jgi:hypothetical protein
MASIADSAPVSDAERALIRAEMLTGTPGPDISEPADVAVWRGQHTAELAGGDPALYRAAAEIEHAADAELSADLCP